MEGIFDVHCHILPQIDDGAEDLEETLKLLKIEYDSGVRNIICTPHYRRNMFETNMDDVSKCFQNIQAKAAELWKELRLYLGCEFHIHTEMMDKIDSDKRYRINGGRYVLLEFSEVDDYSKIRSNANLLQSSGYKPVIAHAERYPCLSKRIDRMEELKDMRIWLQINSGSILGKDGWAVKRLCRKLLNRNLVDLVGSDCHNERTRTPDMGECAAFLIRKYGTTYTEQLLVENPMKMLWQ